MIFVLVLSAFGSILGLLSPVISQRILDYSIPEKNITELVLLCVLLAACLFISIIFTKIRSNIMAKVAQDIIYDIRMDLFAHLQKLPFSYYDDRPHGKILVRIVQYVNNVSDMLSNGIVNFILEIFNLIFIIIFMLCTSIPLALVILSGLPILFVYFFLLKPAQRRAWQAQSNKNSNMNAYLQESINGMRVTQIFTREDENLEIFTRLSKETSKKWKKASLLSNLTFLGVENISQTITAFLYLTGMLWMHPAASLGTFVAMGNYSWRFWQPINNLAQIYTNFLNTIAYLERIFEAMDEPVLIDDAPDAYDIPEIKGEVTFDHVVFGYEPGNTIAYLERIFEAMDEPVLIDDAPDAYDIPEIKGEVTFDHVVFGYEPGKVILNDVSFDIKPGQSVALVGPTGAGKTTVVNLISRFYDVNSGRVLIDGHDISKVTLH